MSVTSGFFNSLNGDRRYNAEQMSALFDGLINDGVFANVGDTFAVSATTGNTITVGVGRAWFNSAWLYNDAVLPIVARDTETLVDRIDAVVIEMNYTESVRSGSIKIVDGTPSSKPERPTMTKLENVHQYPLAYIYRKAGATAITQSDITNMVGTSECPFVTGILEVTNIDAIVAQWQNQFTTWFESLDEVLDENTAVKLANQILELDGKFDTLAKERAVYTTVQDSDGNAIQSSSGADVQGRSVFAGVEKGAGSVTVIPKETSDSFKVGDTLTTARIDLGSNWLLCNGATVDRESYPGLSDIMPPGPSAPWNTESIIKSASTDFRGIEYINGYYILCGGRYTSPNYEAIIVYSTSLNGPWTTKVLWRSNSSGGCYCYGIAYGNGYYVASGYKGTSSMDSQYLAYSRTLGGTWSEKEASVGGNSGLRKIMYNDGKFIAVGSATGAYGEAQVRYSATSDPSGSWIGNYIWRASADYSQYTYATKIIYAQGYYVAVGKMYGSDHSVRIAYSQSVTTSSGQWSIQTIWQGEPQGATTGEDIIYENGKYIICGGKTNDSSSYSQGVTPMIAYATTPSGPWTTVAVSDEISDYLVGIVYANGKYTAIGRNGGVYFADDLNGPWFYKYDPLGIAGYTMQLNSLIFDGSEYVAVGNYTKTGDHNSCIRVTDNSVVRLPSISLSDAAYTYIKAKEE